MLTIHREDVRQEGHGEERPVFVSKCTLSLLSLTGVRKSPYRSGGQRLTFNAENLKTIITDMNHTVQVDMNYSCSSINVRQAHRENCRVYVL